VDNVVQYGGLLEFDLASKLISFGVDRVLIFLSVKSAGEIFPLVISKIK
jgi:hypothetical protein